MDRGNPTRTLPIFGLLLVATACRSPVGNAHARLSKELSQDEVNGKDTTLKGFDTAEANEMGRKYLVPETSDGSRQSPINISTRTQVRTKRGRVKLDYKSNAERAINQGDTVKVSFDPGSIITHRGRRYMLKQYHFHTPSEHLVDGITYPMEMHLVHTNVEDPDQYLVIGVLFKEGKSSAIIQSTIDAIRNEAVGSEISTDEIISVRPLFRKSDGFYAYKGSLTTPPYSETVRWLVRDRIHEASAAQIRIINELEGNNARHIQDIETRRVVHLR